MLTKYCGAAAILFLSLPAGAETLLNPVFQDHAVLQRDKPISLWGTAAPDTAVTVALGKTSVEVKAGHDGTWHAGLPAMSAGGPYTITVKSGNGASQAVSDVLIGDVYLCSGQSNMAYPVMAAIDAGPDIQVSADDGIRLMTVANVIKPAPQTILPSPITWTAAQPKSVAPFSAACYYFGRELKKSVNVPLGLIQSAWSGANITSFMSAEALNKAGDYRLRTDALKLYAADPAAGIKRWGEIVEAYWRKKGITPWSDTSSAAWPQAPGALGIWTQWGVPALANYVGHVWFKTSVTLTAAQAAQAAQLSLGTVTEEDQTWVNGRFISSTFGYGEARTYALDSGVLHEGKNDIVIDVLCGWKGCGIFGPAEARAIKFAGGAAVPLSQPWYYRPVEAKDSPRIPWGATAGITGAYNGMIAPLGDYGLKGVLWYQGESNVGDATYRTLLKAWMEDWRAQFQSPDLAFLIVQLPDNGLPPFKPEESGWAQLREQQRLAVHDDAHAALAVTIDIGDHMGLHPAAKQEVGRRLALAAERLIYGDSKLKSGPVPQSAVQKADKVSVRFGGINGHLAAVNATDPIGFELCGASQESCRFTVAKITGDTVQLSVPEGLKATRVRYCWADGPVCTLYDSSRIPAVPFELPLETK